MPAPGFRMAETRDTMPIARRNLGKSWAVIATALLLSGTCAGKKISPLELRVARLEEQVAALETARTRLLVTVDSLQVLVAAQTREVRERRAVGNEEVARLQTTVASLQTELESLRLDVSELRDRLQFEVAPGTSGTPTGAATGDSPRALYEAAYQDLAQGKHDLARLGFNEVLSRYPTSTLADNAQYWIGEAYYDQKDYERALEEFAKVEQNYPSGDKVPAALLKLGMTQQELGRTKSARKTFEGLIERFPSSEEAGLARSRLSGP